MDWFGRKRRAEGRRALETALAEISARHNAMEVFIYSILNTLSAEDRKEILGSMRQFVVKMGDLSPATYVPDGNEVTYRNELSRVLQLFIEETKDGWPKISN